MSRWSTRYVPRSKRSVPSSRSTATERPRRSEGKPAQAGFLLFGPCQLISITVPVALRARLGGLFWRSRPMFKRTTGVILPPPVIYLLFIAAAWILDALLPLELPRNLWTHYFGWGLVDAGLLRMLWAGLLMLWRKTTVNPYGKPARLLSEGPFRLSRNPIYLGDTLIYVGIALLWGTLWLWLLLPALIY